MTGPSCSSPPWLCVLGEEKWEPPPGKKSSPVGFVWSLPFDIGPPATAARTGVPAMAVRVPPGGGGGSSSSSSSSRDWLDVGPRGGALSRRSTMVRPTPILPAVFVLLLLLWPRRLILLPSAPLSSGPTTITTTAPPPLPATKHGRSRSRSARRSGGDNHEDDNDDGRPASRTAAAVASDGDPRCHPAARRRTATRRMAILPLMLSLAGMLAVAVGGFSTCRRVGAGRRRVTAATIFSSFWRGGSASANDEAAAAAARGARSCVWLVGQPDLEELAGFFLAAQATVLGAVATLLSAALFGLLPRTTTTTTTRAPSQHPTAGNRTVVAAAAAAAFVGAAAALVALYTAFWAAFVAALGLGSAAACGGGPRWDCLPSFRAHLVAAGAACWIGAAIAAAYDAACAIKILAAAAAAPFPPDSSSSSPSRKTGSREKEE
jgi:hypothetical protein